MNMRVRTRSVAPQYLMQYLMPSTFRYSLSCAFVGNTNENKNVEKRIPTWKDAGSHSRNMKVALFEWPDNQHERATHGGLRSALRNTRQCESKHMQTHCLERCEQCAECCVSSCPGKQKKALVAHVYGENKMFVATSLRSNDLRLVERSHHVVRRLVQFRGH